MNKLKHDIPYAIMFHHFKNEHHYDGQGAITADEFIKILDCYQDQIISADLWLEKAKAKTLAPQDICLSFDDNLKCQYDVAYPILKERGIKAFWFIYTQIYEDQPVWLELIRKFRFTSFDNVDAYYACFFETLEQCESAQMIEEQLSHFNPEQYLHQFPFYSFNDRKFRFIRNEILSDQEYLSINQKMMNEKSVQINVLQELMWMSQEEVAELSNEGHVIGMHSHSHPSLFKNYTKEQQLKDYSLNANWIKKITGRNPTCMSHPVNSYNADTLEVLPELNIELGFCSNMKEGLQGILEWPREDHMNVLKALSE